MIPWTKPEMVSLIDAANDDIETVGRISQKRTTQLLNAFRFSVEKIDSSGRSYERLRQENFELAEEVLTLKKESKHMRSRINRLIKTNAALRQQISEAEVRSTLECEE